MTDIPDNVPMTPERIKELSMRTFHAFNPTIITSMEKHLCPCCGKVITADEFRDDLSKREYNISGMCQKCQDSVFNEG